MPPRVAILCEFPTLNGGERSLLTALGCLTGRGAVSVDSGSGVAASGFPPVVPADSPTVSTLIDPILCCPTRGPLVVEATRLGFETAAWECRDAAGSRRPQPELLAALRELVDRLRPDLLHANSLAMGRLTGAAASSLAIPTTSHLRDIVRLSAAAVADLNRNIGLAAVSEATRAYHVGQGLDPARVVTVYNGVDLDRFRPRAQSVESDVSPRASQTASLRSSWGLPADAFLVATIGQIGLRKGHDILARAAALVGAQFPSMHFLIVGERYSEKAESRDFERAIEESFRAAGLADRLHRLGYRDDVAELLREIDLLVHPARQEPLGRVLLEAAAAGLAIVATDVGGTREILTDGDDALLCPPNDAEAMAAAIRRLAGDPVERAALGSAARRRAESHFDLRRTAPVLAEFWRIPTSPIPHRPCVGGVGKP